LRPNNPFPLSPSLLQIMVIVGAGLYAAEKTFSADRRKTVLRE
jgi:hypothetical protein